MLTSASAVRIELNYDLDTSNFFDAGTTNGAAARATAEAAAQFYTDIIIDSLGAIDSNVATNDNYEVRFGHPSGTGIVTLPFFEIPADTVRIYIGAGDIGSNLGRASTATVTISGSPSFLEAASTRGQDFSSGSAEIAPAVGSIVLNSRTGGAPGGFWNLRHTSTGRFFNNDLYSTIIHEIGHILGVGSSESFDSFVDTSTDTFSGSRTTYFNGGKPLLLTGDNDHVDTQLETNLHPAVLGSEAHPATVQAAPQVSALLSARARGRRHYLTLLDTAILDDIGWEINYLVAVPEPSTGVLAFSAFAFLAMRRRRA